MTEHKTNIYRADKPYYSVNEYLKNTYGEKVYRISLDAGFSCPNRDGYISTDGCAFCSAGGSGDFAGSRDLSITKQLRQGKEQLRSKCDCHKFIAYFQAFTNTYAPVKVLRALYTEAMEDPEVVALSIATRPDCINEEVVALLSELSLQKPIWIELGLQTIHDETRKRMNSGFSYPCFLDAVSHLHANRIPVIVHLILGLPGETREDILSSVQTVSALPVWGIKLQLLHVLRGTALGLQYLEKPFPVYTLEEYTELLIDCIEQLPAEMVIHRITGDGPRALLIAPVWSLDKKKVLNYIHRRFRERGTWQGRLSEKRCKSEGGNKYG
ncbi:MAG: TIGR01212 family radical SAM protein [Roseburia sp.]